MPKAGGRMRLRAHALIVCHVTRMIPAKVVEPRVGGNDVGKNRATDSLFIRAPFKPFCSTSHPSYPSLPIDVKSLSLDQRFAQFHQIHLSRPQFASVATGWHKSKKARLVPVVRAGSRPGWRGIANPGNSLQRCLTLSPNFFAVFCSPLQNAVNSTQDSRLRRSCAVTLDWWVYWWVTM
jgi:hypothetical protein